MTRDKFWEIVTTKLFWVDYWSDIRVVVVNGEVVAAMKRQGSEGDFRSNLHQGGSAEEKVRRYRFRRPQ